MKFKRAHGAWCCLLSCAGIEGTAEARRSRVVLLMATLLFASGLSGCGSDDEDSPSPQSEAAVEGSPAAAPSQPAAQAPTPATQPTPPAQPAPTPEQPPVVEPVISSATEGANSAGFAYNDSLKNVSLYGRSTGLLVAGRCNRYAPAIQQARAKGAEVLAYLNATERPMHQVCALDKQLYMNNYGAVPLWPYPSYGQRQIWANNHMTDIRAGSKWILHVVSYVEGLMREGKVDGVFLDVLGARPWGPNVHWESWSQAEKNAWTDGAVDLVRRLDESRRLINPNFIIVNNNVWDRGDTRGLAGEKYVAGVTIEHPRLGVPPWQKRYAQKAFGNVGHRRLIVMARNKADAQAWAKVPGVTHVSDQMYYGYPTPPPVGFRPLTDRN
ncbi:MAG TPA: hypothetical protein VJS42_16610 [Steroidobacteraceae bacterium]|nr:hypothetical protein [Steroidobacteraceae bacterium]